MKSINYNKELQNKLDITLNNYIFYSWKYIIYEKYGIWKGYSGNYDDILLCEGGFLNGERSGKGKEYYYHIYHFKSWNRDILRFEGERIGINEDSFYDGKLKFEGEYLHGERNGKGKEYDYYGKLKFEGEYLNGKRWNGKVKEYYNNGKLEFEGVYLNGEKTGEGKEYYDNGKVKYEGEYNDGKWNGQGKVYKMMVI